MDNKILIVDDITMAMLREDEDIKPIFEELQATEDDVKVEEIVVKLENKIKSKFGVEEIYFAD